MSRHKLNLKTDIKKGTRCGIDVCGARKKDGTTCKAFAGIGTGHLGIGKCKWHGGSTPSHLKYAVKIDAQRRMAKLGAPIEVDPAEALLWTVHAAAGHATWLREQVAELPDLGTTHEARVLVELYGGERDRLTRAAKAALDAGIAEREIRLAEATAETIVRAIHRATKVIGLTPAVAAALNKAVAEELRSLEAAPEPASMELRTLEARGG